MLNLNPLNAQTYQWGESDRIGISKEKIENLIKEYVDLNHPKKVEEYKGYIRAKKLSKLSKYKEVMFIDGDLMWQDDKNNEDLKMNTLEATIYCRNLRHITKKDWRLPSYDELLGLVDYYRMEPAALKGLNYIKAKRYWSSSGDATDISANWYVDFKSGETGVSLREIRYNVRCVRDISKEEGDF